MNELLKIQSEIGLPEGQARLPRAERDSACDEGVDDQSEWLGVSTNYSPYHAGYTTNHWLLVFRAVEATA